VVPTLFRVANFCFRGRNGKKGLCITADLATNVSDEFKTGRISGWSCWSASSRWAMYLPEKPNAPVTAIRTPVSHQADRTSFAREDYALGLP
jgi:hypothetical protein